MIILIILILVLILTLFLMNKTFKKKDNILDEVKLQENAIKNDGFALMLQQSDGTYKESKSSSWPTDMVFNAELSGCMDANGKKIDNALNYNKNTNSIKLKVNGTTYCYVYFDQADNNFAKYLINNVSSSELWDSPLEGDGYRYVGEYEYDMEYSTVISPGPSNYICFGTTNKSKCLSNPDTYMYRIIGIFENEDGDNHLKLIKKTALDTTYQWASDAYSNVDFTGSEILNGLSSSYFMTNTSYPYMQNTNWKNMIELWDYKYANTKTFEIYQENYPNIDSYDTGISYAESEVGGIYLHEFNRSNKNANYSYNYTYQDSAVYPDLPSTSHSVDPNFGEWGWEHTEVSLMYVSDYALSLGETALKYISQNDYSKLKKGWIHLSNNDNSAPASNEWTMTKFGLDPLTTGSLSRYDAWSISSTGTIDYTETSTSLSYRPVFYLKSDAKYGSGTGTSSDPYIIDMGLDASAASEIIRDASSNELWKSTLEGDGYRYIGTNPNNYICFGTNDWENCIYTKDKYMYRIIGVFEDSEGNNHLKLIKYNALDNASYYSSYGWEGIVYFDENWDSKISTWNYTVTNTKTYDNGPDYNSITIKDLYLHELNRSSKTSNIGEWSSYSGKIGVMYASDYALSLGSKALNYTVSSYASTLATGWMYLSNNDSNPPESQEWTLSSSDGYNGWYIDYNLNDSSRAVSVRPVFYLNSDVEFTYKWIGSSYSGDGTINHPYMLK